MNTLQSIVLLSCVLSSGLAAVPGLEERVDELFRPVSGGKSPGAAVAVVRDGNVVLMKAYGMADVEKGISNSPSTIFRLGSVTKSFTAIAVLQLVEDGKLRLEDPLSKYLEGFPRGDEIRISNLLSHTAGLPDFTPYEELKKRPLEFDPGSRINYSNSGYFVLGHIIEKVSGQPWDEYLRDHVFTPSGMKHSGYDKSKTLDGRATGYLVEDDRLYHAVAADDALGAYAAGGLYSTVEDLSRWEQALAAGKLVRKETLEMASTPFTLAGGRRARYGLGFMTATHRGLEEVGHGGDITGFNTYVARYPRERFAVIVLSNTGMRPPGPLPTAGDLAHRIAEIWLADSMQKPEERIAMHVDPKILDLYTGKYRLDAPEVVLQNTGTHIIVTRSGDRLVAESKGMRFPLDAQSKTVFQAVGSPAEFTFVCGTADRCESLVVSLLGLREFRAIREK
jgi:CubicO group peptidase (beta-lactamase class C family)